MLERRIQRQTLIEGWRQDLIDGALLVNLGEGLTPRYSALLASCLEIGRILQVGREQSPDDNFMGRKISGNAQAETARIIKEINGNVGIGNYYGPILSTILASVALCRPIFFHSGNNWDEKRQLLSRYVCINGDVRSNPGDNTKFLLSSANDHQLRAADYDYKAMHPAYFMPQFEGERATPITAIASAAICLGEAITGLFNKGANLDEILTWNLLSEDRLSHTDDFDWSAFNPAGKKIAVIGMGATGMMYLEATHKIPFDTFYLYDFDKIELTNLARAPHFAGFEGKLKAETAAAHFSARNTAKYIPVNEKVNEDTMLPPVDMIACCVDGFDNQLRISNLSQMRGIPLVLGGCTPFTTNVYAYLPGKTSSMLSQYDFLKQAYLSAIRQEHRHCTDPDVEPSNVLTTALCAAIMAGETINLLSGHPLKGPFMYQMLKNPRFEYVPLAGTQDLGTEVAKFTPLPRDAVVRGLSNGVETITVNGIDFEQWYQGRK